MSLQIVRWRYVIVVGLALLSGVQNAVAAEQDFGAALERLQSVSLGPSSQTEAQRAWRLVAGAGADQLTAVLAAMRHAQPLAENWLRSAVDAIAERQLRATGELPADALEEFVLDVSQSPRARRTAYEWLARTDPSAPDRLLPEMLDDPSLELRYDAVARLIATAEQARGNEKIEEYQQAFAAARNVGQIKQCVTALEEMDRAPDVVRQLGLLTQWQLIGPFDNVGRVGYEAIYPPEQEIDFSQHYTGKSAEVAWRSYETQSQELEQLGMVDLNEAIVEEKGVVAYAVATIRVDEDQAVECRYETHNASKLWINGELVASNPVYHAGSDFDQYVVPVQLKRGENTVLLKICQNQQTQSWARDWGFRLRITDKLGGGLALENTVD